MPFITNEFYSLIIGLIVGFPFGVFYGMWQVDKLLKGKATKADLDRVWKSVQGLQKEDIND